MTPVDHGKVARGLVPLALLYKKKTKPGYCGTTGEDWWVHLMEDKDDEMAWLLKEGPGDSFPMLRGKMLWNPHYCQWEMPYGMGFLVAQLSKRYEEQDVMNLYFCTYPPR